jgi:hypothetical protein
MLVPVGELMSKRQEEESEDEVVQSEAGSLDRVL